MKTRAVAVLTLVMACPGGAGAQTTTERPTAGLTAAAFGSMGAGGYGAQSAAPQQQNPFLGSAPVDPAKPDVLPLTLSEAIERALSYNLGVVSLQQRVDIARGARWRSLAGLLPTVQARAAETREKVNLAAFGFRPASFPGVPTLVGPFDVFDARLYISQPVIDVSSMYDVKRDTHSLDAARLESRNARDVVVLVASGLYLQAVAGASRVEATRAQVETSQALLRIATDMKSAGVVPGIDVLRAQVQMETARQRLIVADNDFQKQKLQLARAIGLSASQSFDLVDRIPYATLPQPSLEQALQQASGTRADYLAARARLEAAVADHRAAAAGMLPSVAVTADYGAIGSSASDAKRTFAVAGAVRLALFDGGRHRARMLETEAVVRERQAEVDDFRQRVETEVRTAFLDLQATSQGVELAQNIVELADRELTQARDRFSAGVANNMEVVRAQEAVAAASENRITSLYAFNVARVSLARAMGVAEQMSKSILTASR